MVDQTQRRIYMPTAALAAILNKSVVEPRKVQRPKRSAHGAKTKVKTTNELH